MQGSRCALVALLALLAGAAVPAQAQTTMRAWNIHPDGYPVTEAMTTFSEQVARETGGRYRITVYSNSSLGDQPKAVQMMKASEIELAEFNLQALGEAVPGVKALTLPFLFRDSNHMFRHLDGKLGQRFETRLREAGYVVLGWYDGGARSFYCSNRQVRNAGDFQGLRIRVQKSEAAMEMVTLLGGTPLVIPYKEVFDALKDGKVDCAENNLPSYESTGHYKVAKYVFVSNHSVTPEALVMSSKAWEALSPADQKVFKDAGLRSARRMRELWNKRVDDARALTTKAGAVYQPAGDSGPLVSRMGPLYKKYLADSQTREELLTIIAE